MPSGFRVTESAMRRIRKLAEAGKSNRSIAAVMGCDPKTINRAVNALKEGGQFIPAPDVPMVGVDEEQYAAIAALIVAGLNTAKIMQRTGYSEETVLAARAERTRRRGRERAAKSKLLADIDAERASQPRDKLLIALQTWQPMTTSMEPAERLRDDHGTVIGWAA